jgi:hypothetical protein
MSTLSLIISLVSLSLAVAMAVVLTRVRREERQRSAARVAALNGMAATDFLSETESTGFVDEDLPMRADAAPIFAAPEAASPWGARLAIAGVAVALIAVVGSLTAFRGSHENRAASASAAPLELVALTHQQSGAVLTVTGRVRNPRGAVAIQSPTATVFLFGADGSFLTSGRSQLETPTLAPGSESAFAINVPVNGAVARYRVSFRDSSNHPVAHLDRRISAPVARNE